MGFVIFSFLYQVCWINTKDVPKRQLYDVLGWDRVGWICRLAAPHS